MRQMADDHAEAADSTDDPPPQRPIPPELPGYILDGLDARDASELDAIAEYASQLAAWKRADAQQRETARQKKSERYKERLRERGIDASPSAYEGVPDRAYVNIKAGGEAYYWQWRKHDGDGWGYKYIATVEDA